MAASAHFSQRTRWRQHSSLWLHLRKGMSLCLLSTSNHSYASVQGEKRGLPPHFGKNLRTVWLLLLLILQPAWRTWLWLSSSTHPPTHPTWNSYFYKSHRSQLRGHCAQFQDRKRKTIMTHWRGNLAGMACLQLQAAWRVMLKAPCRAHRTDYLPQTPSPQVWETTRLTFIWCMEDYAKTPHPFSLVLATAL